MDAERADLLRALEDALAEEQRVRRTLRDAVARVGEIAGLLLQRGERSFKLAAAVARALGLETTVEARRRIASWLRQRASRATRRHGKIGPAPLPAGAALAPNVPSSQEVEAMKLVKKTTTVVEEFKQSEDDEALGGTDDEDESEDLGEANDDGEEDEPKRAAQPPKGGPDAGRGKPGPHRKC